MPHVNVIQTLPQSPDDATAFELISLLADVLSQRHVKQVVQSFKRQGLTTPSAKWRAIVTGRVAPPFIEIALYKVAKKWDAQRPDGYRFGQLGYTENPMRRKNPVTATAAQVFEKARQSGYPTEGFTAQQLVDAMWPSGEVRLQGTGAKVVRRGRSFTAMTERKMVGNPRGAPAKGYHVSPDGEVFLDGNYVGENTPAARRRSGRSGRHAPAKGYHVSPQGEVFLNGSFVGDVTRENPRHPSFNKAVSQGNGAVAMELFREGHASSLKEAWALLRRLKTGDSDALERVRGSRIASSYATPSRVTHEDLVDAGLRRNPGLVWQAASGALVALGKGNKVRYTIDENYGHKDTGYHYVLHVAPTLGGRGTSYAAKTIDHAKEMAEASEDPSLRKNPNLRRNHHLQPGDAFVTPEGRYGWVTGAPKGGRYPVKWEDGSKGTVRDTLSAAVPI